MGRNRKKCCIYCKKDFRSDYLQKHALVCKQRPEKPEKRKVKNSGIEKYLNVEADHSDSDPEALVIDSGETADDREFSNDEEQEHDDQNAHRLADNKKLHEEVKRRLRDMGMKIPTDAIAEMCNWCKEEVSNIYIFFYLKINRECCISFLHNT